jgi:hypothetical protein
VPPPSPPRPTIQNSGQEQPMIVTICFAFISRPHPFLQPASGQIFKDDGNAFPLLLLEYLLYENRATWEASMCLCWGTTILTFFEKMKIPDPLMDAILNSKTHLRKPFFVFTSCFVHVWLHSLQKVLL